MKQATRGRRGNALKNEKGGRISEGIIVEFNYTVSRVVSPENILLQVFLSGTNLTWYKKKSRHARTGSEG
jgi:hypothetical protein